MKSEENPQFKLEFIFRRFEERFAVLENELTGEIHWPLKNLPEDLKPNDKVRLKIETDSLAQQEQIETLKKTLEELIN
jgi:hypothetical protein